MVKRVLPVILAGIVILGAGVVHGILTLRWEAPQEMLAAAEKVPAIPLKVGEWAGEDLPIDKEQLKQTEAHGAVSRRYVNNKTGTAVVVLLLCGRAGPLSVHQPTVCFQGTGHVAKGNPRRFSLIGDAESSWGALWTADFEKAGSTVPEEQRVFWGWSDDASAWQAPDHPRVTFVGRSYLYKLYVVRELPTAADNAPDLIDDDPCSAFLRVFLPEAKRALRPSHSSVARVERD
jgi:Protein of unknown function (DUF3485)